MKDIIEYLDKYNPDKIAKNEWFYNEINEYYQKDIPQKYIILYNNCNLLDFSYLNENLQTHDYKKLQNHLLKEYGDYIEEFKDYSGSEDKKSFYILLKNQNSKYNLNEPKLSLKNILNKTKEVETFFNLLDFFNYQLSKCKYINNIPTLYIEPIYSEDASKYFDKCHRQAYHFTYKKNVESILKNGLRIKPGTYRNFPNRIYLWASDDNKINKNKINDFIKKLFGNNYKINNLGIIKVDLYNYNIPIYKDTAMKNKEALFIYNNVPAKLCKEIKLKFKENE